MTIPQNMLEAQTGMSMPDIDDTIVENDSPHTALCIPNHPMHAIASMRLIMNWAPFVPSTLEAIETVGSPVSQLSIPTRHM